MNIREIGAKFSKKTRNSPCKDKRSFPKYNLTKNDKYFI